MSSEHIKIRSAIAARLQQVAGIGAVYTFERYAKTEKEFRDLYAAAGTLLGWHIRRVGRKEDVGANEVFSDWEIRGFRALEDSAASELAFDTLYDAICDAFREDPTLAGNISSPKPPADVVPQLLDSGPVMFSGVLCHSMRLKLTTRSKLFLRMR